MLDCKKKLQAPHHFDSFTYSDIIVIEINKSSQSSDGQKVPWVVNPWNKFL